MNEENLIQLLELADDPNIRATLVQSYIASYGPIKNEYGQKIRDLLKLNKGD